MSTHKHDLFTLVTIRTWRKLMNVTVSVDQSIQEWGNGLGVRITAPVAKAARLVRGTQVKVEVVEGGIMLRVVGRPQLTLAQKLKAFDPIIHGGELLVTGRLGSEVF
jgi:antitoxin MazE